MKSAQCSLLKICKNGSVVFVELELPSPVLTAGQFLLARNQRDILPAVLFSTDKRGQYIFPMNSEFHWEVGDDLLITFPHGHGFTIKPDMRKLLMISQTSSPVRLFSAARQILENGGEAALFSRNLPDQVPPEIEVLSDEQLDEAVLWSDAIIGDAQIHHMDFWQGFQTKYQLSARQSVQILVDTPIACDGTAECGVCAIKTHAGWKQACSDGPVFNLRDLEF